MGKKIGNKCDTQDGSFSKGALRHRKGDGYTPQKARRAINKKIRKLNKIKI